MKVSEIFQSIQGEGPDIGKRAIFVRLHGCNLACPWCDTKYAWEESNFYELTPQMVMEWVLRVPSVKHIVITGGEPLLQLEEVTVLTRMLHDAGRSVAIETNGTIIPPDLTLFDLIVVSPKGLDTADAWFKPSLENTNIELKFVVHAKNIDMITDWIKEKGLIGVYIMPIGTTAEQLVSGCNAVFDKMLEKNLDCIICPRLHVLAGMK